MRQDKYQYGFTFLKNHYCVELGSPEPDLVRDYSHDFHRMYYEHYYEIGEKKTDNELREEILEKVFRADHRSNSDLQSVIIKCTLLNSFYRTFINNDALVSVARHITALNIDERLCSDNEKIRCGLVNEIAYRQNDYKRKFSKEEMSEDHYGLMKSTNSLYSFAAKYCSFHYPELYPIADSISKELLYVYMKEYVKSKTSLNDYNEYYNTYMKFMEKFDLNAEGITLKMTDEFFWTYAQQYIIKPEIGEKCRLVKAYTGDGISAEDYERMLKSIKGKRIKLANIFSAVNTAEIPGQVQKQHCGAP